MNSRPEFEWIPMYEELAGKLLDFEDRQAELISVLRELKNSGHSVVSLEDKNSESESMPLREIDPFTFFASFNRTGSFPKRSAALSQLKSTLALKARVPSSFPGIPIVNAQAARFFGWQTDRQPGDIQALWLVARSAVEGGFEAVEPDAFNRCLRILSVGLPKLTIGLFWLAPHQFLPYDANTRNYLTKRGVGQQATDFESYREVVERAAQIESSTVHVSFDAWKETHEEAPPEVSKESVDVLISLMKQAFPGWESFRDPEFEHEEILYKQKASLLANKLLAKGALEEVLRKKEYKDFVNRLRKVARATNLLFLARPSAGDLSLLNDSELSWEDLCPAVFDLLHGEGESGARLQVFADWQKHRGLKPRWTFPTYFQFLLRPDEDLFIKPSPTKKVLKHAEIDLDLGTEPSESSYSQLLRVARGLIAQMEDLGARDMLDIQSLIWVCGQDLGRKSKKKYWKIAPGESASQWEECLEEGVIVIGWDKLGDISGMAAGQFEKRRDELCAQEPSYKRAGVDQVWKFRNIAIGDQIVANRGTGQVVGVGRVTGPYSWFDGVRRGHRLPVDWYDTEVREVEQPSWRNTLKELSLEEFQEIVDSIGPEPKPRSFKGLLAQLEERGLRFPVELVSNYLLALQAKRFVLLTGISGTGKTQLALQVAQYLQPLVKVKTAQDPGDDGFPLMVRPYMLKHGHMVLPSAFVAEAVLPLPDPSTNSVDVFIEWPEGKGTSRMWRDPNRDVTTLSLKGDLRSWLVDTTKEGDALVLSSEVDPDKPHIRLALAKVEEREELLKNYVLEAVRPDWTDNRGLLGYYNPLSGRYLATPFLGLLLEAAKESEKATQEGRRPWPYFAILDEMNLARVEHYFSDFLSAMESGEAVRLHDIPAVEAGDTAAGEAIPRSVHIPSNLFFVGTVNIDESTYMFSPKVLDRAFTLELNEVNLAGYSGGEPGPDSIFSASGFSGELESDRLPGRQDWERFGKLQNGTLRQSVVALNDALSQENRHFGYRVANEIACFVVLAADQVGSSEEQLSVALDLALLSKALPKLHGTQQELELVLNHLFVFAVRGTPGDRNDACLSWAWALKDGELQAEIPSEADAENLALVKARFPRTARKLYRMRRRLRQQGFTSFIE